jgi:7-carboxy-7-deazaguanine synthase (Cx14CxxC type)
MYQVKEIFYTLQGEGTHSGRPAVFMRFSGCNLWSGREVDRATAQCQFCDTDFVGVDGVNGGKFQSADELALKASEVAIDFMNSADGMKAAAKLNGLLIVLTGGEPLLQVDSPLIEALHKQGFEIAVETNGTIKAPDGIDWICVSPKAGTDIVQKSGKELKLVYGQEGVDPAQFKDWDFEHFYLQPMDCGNTEQLTEDVITYCKAHPQWKLSLQTHKILNIA